MRNVVQFLGGQTVVSEWKPMDPVNYVALDTYTGHLMGVKYDQHDVTVVFSNNTPNLRELRVGQCFTFSGSKDSLEISVVKAAVRDGKVKEMDFSLTLGKGGKELVFVYVEETHLTIKGHKFAGQSSSHILFNSLLFPLLQKRVNVPDVKKEVKAKIELEIIDLSNEEEDVKEEFIDLTVEDGVKDEYVEIEVKTNKLKRELYQEATIEEIDVKKIKLELDQAASVKGKTGPLPSASARLFQPSAALSTLLVSGSTPVTRSQVMKGLWAYIKLHNLQDPSDKNFFSPNLGMLGTFGSERIRGCSMGYG